MKTFAITAIGTNLEWTVEAVDLWEALGKVRRVNDDVPASATLTGHVLPTLPVEDYTMAKRVAANTYTVTAVGTELTWQVEADNLFDALYFARKENKDVPFNAALTGRIND